MSASGYDGYSETFDLEPGPRSISHRFKEVRLDATLSVIHKHAIGSCKGTLHATPQGITYTTDHKEDGFSVTLANIETFAADYVAKSLRIKVRNGKTYNFADPDGNADRLLIFQQQVDKARQRLGIVK
jgi:hypothetical protein